MNINKQFIQEILEPLKKTTNAASAAIMDVYNSDNFNTEIKSDGSPVTEADNKANDIITSSLQNITPDIPVISEETYQKGDKNPSGPYWLVDPLDGTKGFINKDGNFTVNIALVENGMPIFGIIEAPASGKVWFGSFFFFFGRRYRLGALFAFLGPLSIIPWILQSRNYGPYSQTKEMINGKIVYKDGPLRLVMSKNHQLSFLSNNIFNNIFNIVFFNRFFTLVFMFMHYIFHYLY